MSAHRELSSLVRRAQAGDEDAVNCLMTRFWPVIEQIFHPGMAGQDPDLSASDFVQEALVRVWTRLDQFEGGVDDKQTEMMFVAWLRTTSRSVMLNLAESRRAKRRQPTGQRLMLDDGHAADRDGRSHGVIPLDRDGTPSEIARQIEQAERVARAVASLPDATNRAIIELSFGEGISLKQISRRLGIGYDQVRQRFHRTLEDLQRSLEVLM